MLCREARDSCRAESFANLLLLMIIYAFMMENFLFDFHWGTVLFAMATGWFQKESPGFIEGKAQYCTKIISKGNTIQQTLHSTNLQIVWDLSSKEIQLTTVVDSLHKL
jgi:hypothetical protein